MSKYGSTENGDVEVETVATQQQRQQQQKKLNDLVVGEEVKIVSTITNTRILACAFLAALATGAPTYAFGLYSAELKQKLRLSQSQLDTVAAANFVSGCISWIPGMVVDQCGPRTSMSMGGLLMSFLFALYWVLARHVLLPGNSWNVPILSFVGVGVFLSNALVVGSLYKSLVLTCHHSRGAAIGAAKAYVGIGAGVYTTFFDAIPHDSDLDFLLLAAFFAFACIAVPAQWFLPPKHVFAHVVDVSTPVHYRIIYAGLAFLAISVLVSSALFMFRPLPKSMSHLYEPVTEIVQPQWHRAVFLLVGWFGPISALFFLDSGSTNHSMFDIAPAEDQASLVIEKVMSDRSIDSILIDDDENDKDDKDGYYDDSSQSVSERRLLPSPMANDITLSQMLSRPSCWFFLLTCTIVVGSGTTMTNNMGQMVESLQFPRRAASACLSIFSVAQASARAFTGYFSEKWWRHPHLQLPRTCFVLVSALCGMLGHLVLAIADDRPYFVMGVSLVGFSFGMIWPLMVLIIGDLYGMKYHGANYLLFDGFTSAVGTLLISKFVTQSVYEYHIIEDNEITCIGSSCFGWTHASISFLCFIAFLSALYTLILTRRSYAYQPTRYELIHEQKA